ncbi:Protein rrf1, partial [Dinochytrium kinnereticum]
MTIRILSPEEESAKKRRRKASTFLCTQCSFKIGSVISIGPSGEKTWCFAYDSVNLCPDEQKVFKGTWNQGPAFTEMLERRGPNDYLPKQADSQKRYSPPALNRLTKLAQIRAHGKDLFDPKRKPFPRDYQLEMFTYAIMRDSIVVMPTGSGKTMVAGMFLRHMCIQNPKCVGVFIVDRVPLVYQQAHHLRNYTGLTVYEICGENNLAKFAAQAFPKDGPAGDESHIVVTTAGCYRNLLAGNRTRVKEACAIVFDEVHHATGSHNYNEILRRYIGLDLSRPALLGLTASPGNRKSLESTRAALQELSTNLLGAEIVAPSEDVHQNNSKIDHTVDYITFNISEEESRFEQTLCVHFHTVEELLKSTIPPSLSWIKPSVPSTSFAKLPGSQEISPIKNMCDEKFWLDLVGDMSEIPNVHQIVAISHHLTQLLEYIKHSQVAGTASTIKLLLTYLANQRRLVCLKDDTIWLLLLEKAERLFSTFNLDCERELSGKTSRLISYLTESIDFSSSIDSVRGLVFVAERKTAFLLADILNSHEKIKALRPLAIVGQGGFQGMSWADSQKPIIQNFRSGVSKLLIATNVLEEGIDVPACNLVVHYDPPATATSYLQSRGRIRSTSGRFAIIGSQEDLIRVQQVQKQLGFMKIAISSRRNLPFTHSDFLEILKFWKETASTVGSLQKPELQCDKPEFENDNSSSFCSVKVFSHENLTYSFMCDLFEPCGSVVDDVFFSEFSAVCRLRLYLKSGDSAKEWYTNFLRLISHNPKYHGVWTKLIVSSVISKQTEIKESPTLLSVHRGYFGDLHSFFVCPTLYSSSTQKFVVGDESVEIFFESHSWVIPFSFLDRKVIFSEKAGSFRVFLTLLFAPLGFSKYLSRMPLPNGGGPWQLCMTFREIDKDAVINAFSVIPGVELFEGRIDINQNDNTAYNYSLSADVVASLGSLWSKFTFLPIVYPSKVIDSLKEFDPLLLVENLPQLVLKPLEDVAKSITMQLQASTASSIRRPTTFAEVSLWNITPSRIFYNGQQFVQKSRALRQFGEQNFIL